MADGKEVAGPTDEGWEVERIMVSEMTTASTLVDLLRCLDPGHAAVVMSLDVGISGADVGYESQEPLGDDQGGRFSRISGVALRKSQDLWEK